MMHSAGMEQVERQADFDSQAGQADMLQALRSASLPDDFWMYSYKILPCPHGYRHSWTHCPFSHVGETARRRCPRTHTYVPDPCVNARAKRQCPNGDTCPYAHNTFEQWLHPARYRTRLCYLGANCRRPTCFFAHSVEELRSVEENESAGAMHSSMQPPLPPLPIPPPLPSPPGGMAGSGPTGGDFAPTTVPYPTAAAASGTPAASGSGPVGPMLQPMVFVGMPPPQQPQQPPQQPQQQGVRPEMMATHVHGHGYVTYQARPGLPRPQHGDAPQVVPQLQQHMRMAPGSGMAQMAMSVRPLPRPHHPGSTVTVATMHPTANGIHMAPPPAGTMYVHNGMSHMPTGLSMHAPPPPPPPPHLSYSGGYIPSGTFYRGGDGAPPSTVNTGRVRSWSNPGETIYHLVGAPAGSSQGGPSTYGGGEQAVMWVSDASRRSSAGVPAGMMAAAAAPMPAAAAALAGARGGVGAAPRHMPAPTNRGAAMVRRVSTPANMPTTTTAAAAAAAAAAAVAAMHYPESSTSASPQASSPHHDHDQQLQQQLMQHEGMEAALRNLSMAKPVAAPPPTPAASHLGGSLYSPSPSSSPLSASATTASPGVGGSMGYATAAAASQADLTLLRMRSSADGGGPFSRPSSSGSATSVSAAMNVYDANAAATALAAVAASVEAPSDAAAAVTVPYRALLQHVLRSASASAADPPSRLLPRLLNGGAADVVDLEVPYDDDVDGPERSSDPGPSGLCAAIRRISSEMGPCRNSDPGQAVPSSAAAAGVQQLLLPLLQSVLTEGLATGQFELVNGQLQFKAGSSGASFSGGSAAAVEGTGQSAVSGSPRLMA